MYFEIKHRTKVILDKLENIDVKNLVDGYSSIFIIVSETFLNSNKSLNLFIKKISENIRISFNKVKSGEPDFDMVNSSVEIARTKGIDSILVIGGGSKIDLAKAVSAGFYSPFLIEELIKKTKNNQKLKALPIIAIPTTSGTGSELSLGAVLSDPKTKMKSSLRSESIIPKIAILDSSLSMSLNKKNTAITGFDVFTHAIETYFSKAHNPITRSLSIKALKDCYNYLLPLLTDLENLEFREKMAVSSMMMGFNLANSSTCLPHRLQYSISNFLDLAHAECLSVVYPSWLKQINTIDQGRLADLVLTITNGKTQHYENIIDWIESLGIRKTLSAHGLEKESLKIIVDSVSGNLKLDPCYKGKQTLEIILKESF